MRCATFIERVRRFAGFALLPVLFLRTEHIFGRSAQAKCRLVESEVAFVRALTFTDPFPYQAAVRAADIEIIPTAKGEFRAELTQATLNKLWMRRALAKLCHVFTKAR